MDTRMSRFLFFFFLFASAHCVDIDSGADPIEPSETFLQRPATLQAEAQTNYRQYNSFNQQDDWFNTPLNSPSNVAGYPASGLNGGPGAYVPSQVFPQRGLGGGDWFRTPLNAPGNVAGYPASGLNGINNVNPYHGGGYRRNYLPPYSYNGQGSYGSSYYPNSIATSGVYGHNQPSNVIYPTLGSGYPRTTSSLYPSTLAYPQTGYQYHYPGYSTGYSTYGSTYRPVVGSFALTQSYNSNYRPLTSGYGGSYPLSSPGYALGVSPGSGLVFSGQSYPQYNLIKKA